MNFADLSLSQQHECLQRLRLAVLALTMGDDDMFYRVTGMYICRHLADDSPLPESAEMADAVEAWMNGGAS